MRPSAITLPLLYGALVARIPHYPRQDVDPDNPSASDLKSRLLASKLLRVPLRILSKRVDSSASVVHRFPKTFREVSQCSGRQNGGVIAFSGGDLKFDDQRCDDTKKGQLETAAWDALTLATFAGTSAPSRTFRDIVSWKTYIGQLC